MKLTARNLLRHPMRTVSTVLGVALSLALFLGMVIILESTTEALDTSGGDRWEYEVGLEGFQPVNISDPWISPAESGPTASHRGNASSVMVNHGLVLSTKLTTGGKERMAVICALEDTETSYHMVYERGTLAPGGIVISFWHADKLGLRVGDEVALDAPFFEPSVGFRSRNVSLTVTGVQSNHLGYRAFMDLATLQEITNLTGMVNLAHLILGESDNAISPSMSPPPSPPRDRDLEMENMIRTTPGVSSLVHRSERGNIMEEYFDLILRFMYLVALMSTALAGAIVYTLFRITVVEKRREYATMKTLGTSITRIGRLVHLEAAAITGPGLILGSLLGHALAAYLVLSSEQLEVINIPILFSWSGFIVGTLLIILVVMWVCRVTIRFIDHIDCADEIRERGAG